LMEYLHKLDTSHFVSFDAVPIHLKIHESLLPDFQIRIIDKDIPLQIQNRRALSLLDIHKCLPILSKWNLKTSEVLPTKNFSKTVKIIASTPIYVYYIKCDADIDGADRNYFNTTK